MENNLSTADITSILKKSKSYTSEERKIIVEEIRRSNQELNKEK